MALRLARLQVDNTPRASEPEPWLLFNGPFCIAVVSPTLNLAQEEAHAIVRAGLGMKSGHTYPFFEASVRCQN